MHRQRFFAKFTSSFLRKWWFVVLFSLVLVGIGAIVFVFFLHWVDLVINHELPLSETSMTFPWWKSPPVNPVMKIYVYNVTNADEFLNNGSKPIVEELGPYVYVETWDKVNLEFNENSTVSFNQRKVFVFDAEQSAGAEEDVVVVPNVPMLSATSQSKHAARFLRLAMASIMDILKVKPFVEVTVAQLLWGYEDPLIKLAKDVVPNDQKLPYEQFGLLYGKNGTSKDRVTIYTGASDITRYGLIDRYNGNASLLHWKTAECNRLDGSDGSIFPPHIKAEDTIHVYDKDLCRLLPLVFEREVQTAGGVAGFRFTPPTDVFASAEESEAHACFCPGGPPCAPAGFFNVSLCQYDSPILLSFPHFYLAPEKYRLALDGISPPKKEDHQFFLDVQPQMGVSLRARARIQINLAVSQVVDIKQVATFPDIIFPIIWFEDGINELPPEVTGLLSLATRAPPIARAAIAYGLFALGGLLLLLAVGCLVRSSRRQETLRLQASAHYAKPAHTPASAAATAAAAAAAAANGKGKGKAAMETLNPTFLMGPNDNGAAAAAAAAN